jgi:hypothetical protein
MADKPTTKIEGEGSYSAARRYDKAVKGFVARNKTRIDQLAEDAERALDGDEHDELIEAEAKGEAPARK